RLVPSSLAPVVSGTGFRVNRSGEGPADLLDATVDLHGHHGVADGDRAVVATAEALRRDRRPGGVTVAVLGPLGSVARHSRADALETVSALRRAGWHAALVDPSMSLEHAWTLLVEGTR